VRDSLLRTLRITAKLSNLNNVNRKFDESCLEEQILYGEIDIELNRIRDSGWLRDKIAQVAVMRNGTEMTIQKFDQIPTSPSTGARLMLEETGARIIDSNKSLQVLLKALRDYKDS
jgi:hypothetical protein